VVTCSTLIACCERLGDAQRARGVWEWMQQQGLRPDTVCHNTLIACLERCNQPAEALAIYDALLAEAEGGSDASFAALCDALAKDGNWDRLRVATQLKEWMEAQGDDPAQATLQQLSARAAQDGGRWQRAVELFEGGGRAGRGAPATPAAVDAVWCPGGRRKAAPPPHTTTPTR
jgi:pentatricopeptide repeat domain-containing protein 1